MGSETSSDGEISDSEDMETNYLGDKSEAKCKNCQEMVLNSDLAIHTRNCQVYSKFMKRCIISNHYECQICYAKIRTLLEIESGTWNGLRKKMYSHLKKFHDISSTSVHSTKK